MSVYKQWCGQRRRDKNGVIQEFMDWSWFFTGKKNQPVGPFRLKEEAVKAESTYYGEEEDA